MKISNKIIMGILRLIYFLNPQAKNPDRVYPHAKAHNERQVFKIPKGRKIDCERLDIKTEIGSYPCLRIKKKGQNPDIAVLYICGGGGVYDYCRHQLFLAKKLLKWVDAEIYYPFYPPSTKHPIKEAFKMVFETYRTMLDNYSHKKIGVIGVSFVIGYDLKARGGRWGMSEERAIKVVLTDVAFGYAGDSKQGLQSKPAPYTPGPTAILR